MTVDKDRLYWASQDQPVINSVSKSGDTGTSGDDVVTEAEVDVPFITAYGENLQPMPGQLTQQYI